MDYTSLPEEIKAGKFCICLHNDKRPYDPFKHTIIGANDTFYSFQELSDWQAKFINKYIFGLQVGSNMLSAIDIDHCVDEHGNISALAKDIIAIVDSYTEFSPSKTGIRIIFKTSTHFDIGQYLAKNDKLNVEYYDGLTCSQPEHARMVRMSGYTISKKFNADVNALPVLTKYMVRPKHESIDQFAIKYELDFNLARVKICTYLMSVLPEFYDFEYRKIRILSESEWDSIIVSQLLQFTNNLEEIEMIFRESNYCLTKDDAHKKKLERKDYQKRLFNAFAPVKRTCTFAKMLFKNFEITNAEPSKDAISHVGYLLAILKSDRFKKQNISEQDCLNALYMLAENNVCNVKELMQLI